MNQSLNTPVRSSYRFIIAALLVVIQVFLGVIWLAPAPVLSFVMKDYSVDRATVSLSISIVAIAMAIFTIPGGMLAARLGAKKALLIGTSLVSLSFLAPFLPDYPSFLATRLSLGMGVALLGPAISALVMQWFHANELTVMNGLNLVAVNIGNSIALFITVPLANLIGWQNVIGIYGAIALGLAVAWGLMGRQNTQQQAAGMPSSTPSISWAMTARIMKNRTTLLLALSVAGPFAMFNAFMSWLPAYYNRDFGMTLASASALVAVISLVGIPASLLGGVLPSRAGVRKPFFLVPGMVMGFLGFGVFLFQNSLVLYPAIVLLGIVSWLYMPPLVTIVMELPGAVPSQTALQLAISFGIASIAAFISPIVTGYLVDTTGSFIPGFALWTILSWSLLLGGLLLPETGPKAINRRIAAGLAAK